MATMRAKFRVSSVTKHGGEGTSFDPSEEIEFNAVGPKGSYPDDGSDEDNTFAKWTPSARLTMSITNPALLGVFAEGQTYYADFIPAE